uniref:Uncharacterized protein n=1 Tax=Panagrolaimus davidi TaxID=227884 RepID=A0A914Q2N4_9BILA
MWWFLVIAFNVIFLRFVTSNVIEESTVEFRDIEKQFVSYGFIVSENAIILPTSAYNRTNEIKFINGYRKSGLIDIRKLPEGSFKMINDAIFIFTTVNNEFPTNRVTRINRYPFYGHDQYYTALSALTNIISTSFKLLSDDKCGKIASKFNASTQICVQNINVEPKSPLIATSENSDFLVGFANEEAPPNATVFILINQKSYNLPIYDRCNTEKEFPSHFALCNSFEISENLKDRPETILVGNIEVGNNESFLPIELGIVVSDNQILVSLKVNESLENYQIYGDGKKLKVC